jgi:hypothetical protein
MKENKFTVPVNRPLTSAERTLLKWLLDNGISEATAYKRQLTDIHVCSTCSCGCPTIDLAMRDKTERTTGPSQILADAEGFSPEGVPVNVILHARENKLSELEVIAVDGTTNFSLPSPDKLTIINDTKKPQQKNRGDRE